MKSKFLLCALLAICAFLILQFSNANSSNSPDFLTSKSSESSSSNNQYSSQDKSLLEKTKSFFQKTFEKASESLKNLKENLVSDPPKSQEKKEIENLTPNSSETILSKDNKEKEEPQDNSSLKKDPNSKGDKVFSSPDSSSDLEKKTPETAEIASKSNESEESQSWLSQSLNTLKNKTGSVYQGVKDKASNLSNAAQDKVSQLGGAAKEKLSGALEKITREVPAPVSFLVKHWNLIKWVGVVLAACLVLKGILLIFSWIQSIGSLLKAPKEFMTHPFIKPLLVKIRECAQKLRKGAQSLKSGKDKKDSQSYLIDKERGRIRDGSLEMTESTDDETSENEENFYSYYKCEKCERDWETVIIGKNQIQKCRNKECLEQVKPFQQISLLNNKKKQEELDKIKVQ